MDVLLLIVSLLSCLLVTIFRRNHAKKTQGSIWGITVFNALVSFVAMLTFLAWGGLGEISWFSLFLGIAFGIATVMQAIMNLKALETGPMSYTSIFVSLASVIPALSGAMFFGEVLGISHIVGVVLMLISFVLAVDTQNDEKKMSMKWLSFCFIMFACTGCIGVIQKVHQSSVYKNELNAFLIVAFFSSFVFSVIQLGFVVYKNRRCCYIEKNNGKPLIIPLLSIILCGICTAANNKLNLYLSGVMDSAVFFPIVNGGGLILTTLFATIVFKERLSKKQWIGILVGIVSVVFLCNPFS